MHDLDEVRNPDTNGPDPERDAEDLEAAYEAFAGIGRAPANLKIVSAMYSSRLRPAMRGLWCFSCAIVVSFNVIAKPNG